MSYFQFPSLNRSKFNSFVLSATIKRQILEFTSHKFTMSIEITPFLKGRSDFFVHYSPETIPR